MTAVASSKSRSGISTTCPSTPSFSRTASEASPATQSTPFRTSTPTLGITRSTSASGNACSNRSSGTAARIDTTLRAAPSSGATPSSATGFTATTTKSARSAISSLLAASPPSSPASCRARPEPLSEKSIPSHLPAQPRAIAAAMLPDPTKPMIMAGRLSPRAPGQRRKGLARRPGPCRDSAASALRPLGQDFVGGVVPDVVLGPGRVDSVSAYSTKKETCLPPEVAVIVCLPEMTPST